MPIAINFATGDTTPKMVTIPIADDAIGEADERVNLSLTNLTGNARVGDRYNNAVLTIVDWQEVGTIVFCFGQIQGWISFEILNP